jgi:hypothetical protein
MIIMITTMATHIRMIIMITVTRIRMIMTTSMMMLMRMITMGTPSGRDRITSGVTVLH